MAYDEELATRLRLLLNGHDLTEKKMFGGILVRTDPEQTDALRAEPDVQPFVMQGRPMKGWLRVDGPTLDDDAVLPAWAERGLSYATSLPPK